MTGPFNRVLPRVGNLDTILVVVNRFSKYATFIPTRSECKAEEVQAHYDQAATAILDHQVINKRGRNHIHRNTFYLVQWAEQSREAATWEKEVDLW
ncbi:unnamed protein product [Spirodela intermedia]|uniref:Chromo domain-containing protein n=1 Tax=Spirodela intermedia TaxID=51605 RepID=A0A7I8ITI4_SPIIN|nr:unnamed protein product [Spirodela intermedia]CAA6661116.1 unnamed protein product [Spirodela intermedia]